MRTTFINTLTQLARRDDRIMCVIGDTGYSVFEDFEAEFGGRFVNAGISEQNFVSVGAGLASMGMKPYLYNVVSFLTLRAAEQIVLDISYQENPVTLVGVGGGFAYGTAGPTHHALLDIAFMRSLPNMTVVCPGDPAEMKAVMELSPDYGRPLYIRIGRSVDPVIHSSPVQLEIGKALELRKGSDGALFSTGTMLKTALELCEALEKEDIHLALFSFHTVKPIDQAVVLECARSFPAIFTLEEHSITGGFGSAVSEALLRGLGKIPVKFKIFGAPDSFAPVTGSRDYLLKISGLDQETLSKEVKKVLNE